MSRSRPTHRHLPPRADEAMEVEAVIPRISNGDEDKCIGEAGRIRRTTLSITNLRQRNIDDNAAGQWCHGDLGVYVRGWLSLNRGRGRGRRNGTLLSTTTHPHGFHPFQTSPSPANRPPQALAGSDAAAAATTTTLHHRLVLPSSTIVRCSFYPHLYVSAQQSSPLLASSSLK